MLKKLLPIFLFVITIFIFNPNDADSATTCSEYENSSTMVICGPNSSSGNGEILWKNKTESVNNLAVFQAIFNIRDKSQVNMRANSTLTFDGGGCKDKCSSSNPKDRSYYLNRLEVDDSSFFHGGGLNAYAYMKDEVEFKFSNSSNVTFGYIREKEVMEDGVCPTSDGCYTKLSINVKNSDLSIGDIVFENSYSWLGTLIIENDEKNRGKYRVNINNGIRASEIRFIDLKNADVTIGGDVIAYGDKGSGGAVNPVNLDNSDLVLRGNLISQVQAILLVNKSILKVDPRSGNHTLVMGAGGRPIIQVDYGSKAIFQDIKSNAADLDIQVSKENSELTADRIYFTDDLLSFSDINISLDTQAKVKVGVIDTRLDCGGTCNTQPQKVTLTGTENSSFDIGEILFNSNETTLYLNNTYGKIDKLNYYNNEVKIHGKKTDTISMNIGSINLLNDNAIYDIELRDQNIKINEINLKKTDKLDFNIYDSIVDMGNVSCGEYCKDTSFKGYGNGRIINMTNFSSGSTNSTDSSNTFANIELNVSGNYNSNGTFNATDSAINFGSMNGEYDSINLVSSNLTINKPSNIVLTSGDINIDGKSIFTIKGEQIFKNNTYNTNNVNINNSGILDIQAGNNFNSLTNNLGATAKLNGVSSINTIDNLGTLELYTGATIQDLYNQGKLVIYGQNKIEKYSDNADSELQFYVATKNSNPSLIIGEMDPNINLKNLSIGFDGLAVIKPGVSNRYDLIKTEKDSIGIDYDEYVKILDILPPWLIHDENIDQNNGENANNGETAWVSIQRLTNYTDLVKVVPGYGSDNSILALAGSIDNVVFNSRATEGLEDVVNSLDLNSGCGIDDEETQRIIYLIHQGQSDLIDQLPDRSCLYTMAENINKLKPVSNEVYALYSHTNVVKSLDTILEANREYVYDGEIYSWYKGDIGYTNLADKNRDTGFNSINSMFYVGATIAPTSNYNLSGILGFGVGNLNGNKNLYDGTTSSITAGLAGSYLNGTYFISLSTVVGLTNFDTNRHIDFLDNQHSDNKNTKSTANLSVLK